MEPSIPDSERMIAKLSQPAQPKWWTVWLVGLCTVGIFILTYSAIFGIRTLTSSLVPSEPIAVVMAGLIAATLPISLVWNRLTKVKVWEVELELATLAAPQAHVPERLMSEDALKFATSYVRPVLQVLEASSKQIPWAKLLTLNINFGPAWWSTRVYLVAALAREFTHVEHIVFVEDCGGPDDCFIGIATPEAICRAFEAKQPFLADAYRSSQERSDLQTVGLAFVEWFLHESKGEADQQITITKYLLYDWLDESLTQGYVEWHDGPPPVWMLRKILERPEPFVVLVESGRLKLIVDKTKLAVELADLLIKKGSA